MKNKIQSIRGMKDYFLSDIQILQEIENIIKTILNNYGYNEIRTPILENTKLFKRAVGNLTDIVKKEMYTFLNINKKQSLSLRPEGTAGCVRSLIQNNLYNTSKMWYMGPMFRYERPQKGRYRQFYQIGVEVFGIKKPSIDAELILLIFRIWKNLNIHKNVKLYLNNIGTLEERMAYQKILISFFEKNKKFLDTSCLYKLYTNPIKILDSKNKKVQKLLEFAPKISNFLKEKSRTDFQDLCNILNKFNIKYDINYFLVRGLDYYNNTVFEWVIENFGKKITLCAGGRYDKLVELLGGNSTPAIGFAIGLDRLLLLIKTIYPKFVNKKFLDIYIVASNLKLEYKAIFLSEKIRNFFPNCKIVTHFFTFNIKKQIQIANKKNVRFLLILKENLLKKIFLKDLSSGIQKEVDEKQLISVLNKIL